MAKKYYIDTCIWRDYFENRSDKFRPLGDCAFQAIQTIVSREDIIVISDIVLRELAQDYTPEKISSLLEIVPKKLAMHILPTSKQKAEAYILKNKHCIPFSDALHAILARDTDSFLISRDKHFLEIFNVIDSIKPEELL